MRNTCVLLTTLVLGGLPSAAFAQLPAPGGLAPAPRAERPYRGLFGSGFGSTAQSLTLELNVGGGMVSDPLAAQGVSRPPSADPVSRGGGSGVGTANLVYSASRNKIGINASSQTIVDYYPQVPEQSMLPRYVATAGVDFVPSSSTRLTFTQTFKNLPEFSFSDLFDAELEQGPALPQDQGMTIQRYTRYGSAIDFSQKLSKRTSLNGSASYARGVIGERAWTITLVSGSVSQKIAKGAALYVSYQYGGQQEEGPVSAALAAANERQPRLDGGLDFSRPLSFSRRTTMTFTTGFAGTHNQKLQSTTYHMVGSAQIAREFGQSWMARAGFSRNVRHVESLGRPLFADTTSVAVQGSFSRALQFQSRFGHSQGRVGEEGAGYSTYYGGVQLSMALTRVLAFGMDYTYYLHSVKSPDLPLDAFTGMNSRSLRGYVQIWVPLIMQKKRP